MNGIYEWNCWFMNVAIHEIESKAQLHILLIISETFSGFCLQSVRNKANAWPGQSVGGQVAAEGLP